MRSVVQRVSSASVSVSGSVLGSINKGVVALVAFEDHDNEKSMTYVLEKIIGLRIFEDSDGKMNMSVEEIGGGLLIVPNFTLYGDARKGKRPGYSSGAPPDNARTMYDEFVELAKNRYHADKLGFGEFQADMALSLVNDGPVTILLDSSKLF